MHYIWGYILLWIQSLEVWCVCVYVYHVGIINILRVIGGGLNFITIYESLDNYIVTVLY